MNISSDLFRAILAMDSYNRGYNAGFKVYEGNPTSGIGTAAIGNDSATLGDDASGFAKDQAASFYAIAYNWDGGTVISYRGTDDPVADVPGFTTGGGNYDNDQTRLAAEFYRSINGGSSASNSSTTLD